VDCTMQEAARVGIHIGQVLILTGDLLSVARRMDLKQLRYMIYRYDGSDV
jgi:hypothetical protein